jgi:hypothetical protein
MDSVNSLLGTDLVVTEKMDGSNVCLESKDVFARSHGGLPRHPSFDALKALHSGIRDRIPLGCQIFGEWLFAKHSIGYDRLPNYLMLFGVRDLNRNTWSPWAEVEMWAEELGVAAALVLANGTAETEQDLGRLVTDCMAMPLSFGKEREGVVVRKAGEFGNSAFGDSVGKWVRTDHVKTDEHWSHREIIRNKLKVQDFPNQ